MANGHRIDKMVILVLFILLFLGGVALSDVDSCSDVQTCVEPRLLNLTSINHLMTLESSPVGNNDTHWDTWQDGWHINDSTQWGSTVIQFINDSASGVDQLMWADVVSNTSPYYTETGHFINISYDMEITSYTTDTFQGLLMFFQSYQDRLPTNQYIMQTTSLVGTGAGVYAMVHMYDDVNYTIVSQSLEYDRVYNIKFAIDYDNRSIEYWIDNGFIVELAMKTGDFQEDGVVLEALQWFSWKTNTDKVEYLMDNLDFSWKAQDVNATQVDALRFSDGINETMEDHNNNLTLYYDSQIGDLVWMNETGHKFKFTKTAIWDFTTDHDLTEYYPCVNDSGDYINGATLCKAAGILKVDQTCDPYDDLVIGVVNRDGWAFNEPDGNEIPIVKKGYVQAWANCTYQSIDEGNLLTTGLNGTLIRQNDNVYHSYTVAKAVESCVTGIKKIGVII